MAAVLPSLEPKAAGAAPKRVRALLLAGVILLCLAGVSYALSFVALGSFGLPLAVAIAVCKAMTVLFAFMDFGKLSVSAQLAAGAALLMLALLLALMVLDVATRECPPLPPPRAPSAAVHGC